MKKVHDRIVDMRGNLITVIAHNVSLGELAKIEKQDGRNIYASVLRIEGEIQEELQRTIKSSFWEGKCRRFALMRF
jgi:vacuolar-type H+-ATPase subunit B/Vma2